MDNKTCLELYLDYVNNFLTVSSFAEYYDMTEEAALSIIETGRAWNYLITNFNKGV